jgi:isoleucyl-tRNA synthetase
LDAEGKKMSKSRGNVVNPWEIFDGQGADALRWALYTATSPGNPRRFSKDQVDEAVRKHLLTLWNTYYFFITYARIDDFDPREDYVEPGQRSLMDRWALSRLQLTTRTVTERLDAYDVTVAGRAIGELVDELSNWYVRRSRRRFWKGEDDLDKKAAYSTLYECLVAIAKLSAPFTPFIAEALYQNLVVNANASAPESVHLSDWPEVDEALVDEELIRHMAAARKVVALGRAARNAAEIKTRQPLREVVVVPGETTLRGGREHPRVPPQAEPLGRGAEVRQAGAGLEAGARGGTARGRGTGRFGRGGQVERGRARGRARARGVARRAQREGRVLARARGGPRGSAQHGAR